MVGNTDRAGVPEGVAAAAVLARPGSIVLEDRPVPRPAAGEVLVEVRAVGVCGSDVHYFKEGRIGPFVVESPLVLGHEAMGVVIACGSSVSTLQPGDRVALEPGVPCGHCPACLGGHYNLCPGVRFLATPPVDGAFCRYVAHDARFAHRVPDSVSDDAAALLEPLSVALWASWKGGIKVGDRVLVTGSGPIGLLATAVARAAGAAEVVVSDIFPERLALAARFGATSTVDAGQLSEARPDANVLIECSGSPSALDDGLNCVLPAGRAVMVGMSAETQIRVPMSLVQSREITLTGTFRYANTYPAAIALVAAGAIDLDRLVTGHYRLDQVAEALTAGSRDRSAVKPVVVPDGAQGATPG